jgi:hypothetical protein
LRAFTSLVKALSDAVLLRDLTMSLWAFTKHVKALSRASAVESLHLSGEGPQHAGLRTTGPALRAGRGLDET